MKLSEIKKELLKNPRFKEYYEKVYLGKNMRTKNMGIWCKHNSIFRKIGDKKCICLECGEIINKDYRTNKN